VGLPLADIRHAPDEADEIVIARQHKRVDHDAALAARGDLGAGLGDDERVEAERVLVNAAVGLRQRGRLAVGDHNDLAHVLALAVEDAPRQAQALARVRVVRPDPHAAELGQRDLLGRVVKQHHFERIARILRLDELRERQGHALGGREAILAVENHRVAAVEHQDGRARALVLALRPHQVFGCHIDLDRAPAYAEGAATIAEGAATIAEGAATIAEGASTVADRASTIADRAGAIADRATTIAEGASTIADRAGAIADRAAASADRAHRKLVTVG